MLLSSKTCHIEVLLLTSYLYKQFFTNKIYKITKANNYDRNHKRTENITHTVGKTVPPNHVSWRRIMCRVQLQRVSKVRGWKSQVQAIENKLSTDGVYGQGKNDKSNAVLLQLYELLEIFDFEMSVDQWQAVRCQQRIRVDA